MSPKTQRPTARAHRSKPLTAKQLFLADAVVNMPGLITATGVLGFLADEEPELKIFALQTLNDDIDTVWTEVAGALSMMYAMLSSLSLLLGMLTR